MDVYKVLIRGIEIPFKKGICRMVDYKEELTIEVEVLVHPTIMNYIEINHFMKERVTILLRNQLEISGKFELHLGKSSILLTANENDIEGAENFAQAVKKKEKSLYLLQPGYGISLSSELKKKRQFLLKTILLSIKENVIEDEENQIFLATLIEKLHKGEILNTFDDYIKEEIGYFINEVMTK